jgi:chromosome segregation ATPase
MQVSNTLAEINGEVQEVYKEIINNDGTVMRIAKSMPILGGLMKRLDSKWDEAAFNMKNLEGKIQMIFSGFDQAYASLNTSIELQKKFLEGIDANIGKVVAYKEFLNIKIEEFRTKGTRSNRRSDQDEVRYVHPSRRILSIKPRRPHRKPRYGSQTPPHASRCSEQTRSLYELFSSDF